MEKTEGMTDRTFRVLLVEDERKLCHSIERTLQRSGYIVDTAVDGEEGEAIATSRQFELIILDLNLPKKSGFEVLQNLRKKSYTVPVLILTARDKVEDRIAGLQAGADDYLVKPFDSGELLARIQAILRRSGHLQTSVLQAGDLVMDITKRTVSRDGEVIPLSPKEFALLEFLLRNKNQILTRNRILEQVWGYTFETGTNIVEVYISYLRDSIDKDYTKKLIKTIYGEGFLLQDE